MQTSPKDERRWAKNREKSKADTGRPSAHVVLPLGEGQSTGNPLAQAFYNHTGQFLSRFWCKYTGFDVLGFDEWLSPAVGQSTEQAVAERFGPKAVEIVRELLGQPMPIRTKQE